MIKKSLFEEVPCNLCGSKSFTVMYKAQYQNEKDHNLVDKFRASGDELLIDQLVKCNRCGLIFINPRIKAAKIVEAYSEGDDPVFVSQADAREKSFARSLKMIEKYSPRKGKIVDIGTAGGSFLAAAKKRGWDVSGCEPNKWLAKWGNKRYGINIKPGTIFDQKYKANSFDVVTLWDVIEHTPDPKKVFLECNKILKSKGTLIVNYPDIGSWLSRLMGRKWLFLTSVHLYYFTRRTIRKMLQDSGFEVATIKPHFQSLELGYLCVRAGSYSKIISKIAGTIVNLLGMSKVNIPYWLSQTFVVARKKN